MKTAPPHPPTEQYCILLSADTPLFLHVRYALETFLPEPLEKSIVCEEFEGGNADDAKLADYIARTSIHKCLDGVSRTLLGAICDPLRIAKSAKGGTGNPFAPGGNLRIIGAVVKRLGFYVVRGISGRTSRIIPENKAEINCIYAHGGPLVSENQATSTAQALAYCLKRHFRFDNAVIHHCLFKDIPIDDPNALVVTANIATAFSHPDAECIAVSDVLPEWSRTFLSAFACHNSKVDQAVLGDVMRAIQFAAKALRFLHTDDQVAEIIQKYYSASIATRAVAKNIAIELKRHRLIPSNLELTRLGSIHINALWEEKDAYANAVLLSSANREAGLQVGGFSNIVTQVFSERLAQDTRTRVLDYNLTAIDRIRANSRIVRERLDVLVVCALKEELAALRLFFDPVEEIATDATAGASLLRTQVKTEFAGFSQLNVGLFCFNDEMGRVSAAINTSKALRHWRPEILILSGIGGTFRDDIDTAKAVIGDLLIANKVVDYEHQKIGKKIQPRLREFMQDAECVDLARRLLRDIKWPDHLLALRPPELGTHVPTYPDVRGRTAGLLCGDKVVASTKYLSLIRARCREVYRVEPIGVEMESAGVAAALGIATGTPIRYISLKAASDYADEKKGDDAGRVYANAVSAYFAHAFITELIHTTLISNRGARVLA